MPAVGLTARLARDSRRAEKDTILFDKALPGFGINDCILGIAPATTKGTRAFPPGPRILHCFRHLRSCPLRPWWTPNRCPLPIAQPRLITLIREGGPTPEAYARSGAAGTARTRNSLTFMHNRELPCIDRVCNLQNLATRL